MDVRVGAMEEESNDNNNNNNNKRRGKRKTIFRLKLYIIVESIAKQLNSKHNVE